MPEHVAGRGLGVVGLGDDLHVGLGLQDHADPVADELVVVRENDRDPVSRRRRFRVGAHTGTLAIACFSAMRAMRPMTSRRVKPANGEITLQ